MGFRRWWPVMAGLRWREAGCRVDGRPSGCGVEFLACGAGWGGPGWWCGDECPGVGLQGCEGEEQHSCRAGCTATGMVGKQREENC